MAIRKIYCDEKGLFFKGEGFIFRLPKNQHYGHGSHVEVNGVSCGQVGACASWWWRGKLYFAQNEPE